MKVSEVKRLLTSHGCYMCREGRSHEIWYSPMTGAKFTVPRHSTHDVPSGTLKSIMRSAGID